MKLYMAFIGKLFLPGVISAVLFSGCSFTDRLSINPINPTSVIQTAEAVIDKLQPEPGVSPDESAVAAPQSTLTPQASPSVTSLPTVTAPISRRCDQAGAGNPLDVTVPDDARLVPGQTFTKTWRLINLGTCDWTSEYSVVWYSGDDLNAARVQPILEKVLPGTPGDFSVDMTAPAKPGLYAGYWMLRNPSGELFGIGPNSNSPFWVRIQVIAVETPSPTSTIQPEATLIVLTSGEVTVPAGGSFDLDTGQTTDETRYDFTIDHTETEPSVFKPRNNARFAIFGLNSPGELECQYATLSDDPMVLSNFEIGVYLCYRTSQGLPGRLKVINDTSNSSAIEFGFTTWAIP